MTWSILEEMRNHYHNDVKNLQISSTNEGAPTLGSDTYTENESSSDAYSSIHRQIIFTAATLPSRGRQSVQVQLMRWVPKNTLFFNTDHTHQVISLAQMKFIDIHSGDQLLKDDGVKTKFEQLTEDLLSLRDSLSTDSSSQSDQNRLPKVLIFANTVASAKEIFSHLERTIKEREGIWWRRRVGKLHKLSNVSTEALLSCGYSISLYPSKWLIHAWMSHLDGYREIEYPQDKRASVLTLLNLCSFPTLRLHQIPSLSLIVLSRWLNISLAEATVFAKMSTFGSRFWSLCEELSVDKLSLRLSRSSVSCSNLVLTPSSFNNWSPL